MFWYIHAYYTSSLSGMSTRCGGVSLLHAIVRSRFCLTLNIVTCQYQLFHSRANRNKRRIIFYLRFAGCSNVCNEKHVENVKYLAEFAWLFVGSPFFLLFCSLYFLLHLLLSVAFRLLANCTIFTIAYENWAYSCGKSTCFVCRFFFFLLNIFIGPILLFVAIERRTRIAHVQCADAVGIGNIPFGLTERICWTIRLQYSSCHGSNRLFDYENMGRRKKKEKTKTKAKKIGRNCNTIKAKGNCNERMFEGFSCQPNAN